jgi:hypothetical protein
MGGALAGKGYAVRTVFMWRTQTVDGIDMSDVLSNYGRTISIALLRFLKRLGLRGFEGCDFQGTYNGYCD